jgi:hypothetical protein
METFKITESTNLHQASRNAKYAKNTTSRELDSGLTLEEARVKLISFCQEDYEFSIKIETLEDFIREFISTPHFNDSDITGMTEVEYFEATKKRQALLYTRREDRFFKFTGPGIYTDGRCIMNLTDDGYEYDGYYTKIADIEQADL